MEHLQLKLAFVSFYPVNIKLQDVFGTDAEP